MPSILTFGFPRSGTTYMERMFGYNSHTELMQDKKILLKVTDKGSLFSDKEVCDFWTKHRNHVDWHATKIPEGSILHPAHGLSFQSVFPEFKNLVPNPVYLIRTYRASPEIYKSMKIVFPSWDLNKIVASLLTEFSGYLWLKAEGYRIISMDFDRLGEENYLNRALKNLGLPKEVICDCLKYNEEAYGNKPVRPGRLSTGKDYTLSDCEKIVLEETDRFKAKMERAV